MTSYETFEHEGVTVEIHYDEDPESPREWSNIGTMLVNYRGYVLGDGEIEPGEHENLAALIEWIREEYGATVILPLYILDHSGLAMSAGPPLVTKDPQNEVDDTNHFLCDPGGWDTSLVGFIFDTPEGLAECGTPENLERALRSEVSVYDNYLQGQVFGFVIEDGDSCFGYFDYDQCIEDAKDAAEWEAEERRKTLDREIREEIAHSATYAWNGELVW